MPDAIPGARAIGMLAATPISMVINAETSAVAISIPTVSIPVSRMFTGCRIMM